MNICTQCGGQFEIRDTDREFYKKIDVPEPTQCPPCRMRRRLAFRNDKTLYQRTSSKSGKLIIAIYPEGTAFPVYDRDEWYADDWDPLTYGQTIDFTRPFFEQFKEVRDRVPRINLYVDSASVGSPYTNQVARVKNCHLIFSGCDNEDCYYGYRVNSSKNCVDNLFANACELCYECIEAYDSYGCSYSQKIVDCTDSVFLYDCTGCTSCLFCVGLRNKSYCILNTQYSREEYEIRMKEYRFDSSEAIVKMKEEFRVSTLKFPRKFASLMSTEHVTGDNIKNSKDCAAIFDAINDENVSYVQFVDDARDTMDMNYGYDHVEMNYEVSTGGLRTYFVRFSIDIWPNAMNLDYCDTCSNGTADCFGCVGLRKKQYCILNKQYTEDDYTKLRLQLISHMKETGEWGEFFPIALSPFAYNESTAMIFFPMVKEEVAVNGWRWKDDMPGTRGKETRTEIPDSIHDTPDDIINDMLACEACRKNYKIIKQELAFYRQRSIPIPRICFDCRFASRTAQRNHTQLYHRQCMCEKADHNHGSRAEASAEASGRCLTEFETTYAPDRKEIVFCETCYQQEIV